MRGGAKHRAPPEGKTLPNPFVSLIRRLVSPASAPRPAALGKSKQPGWEELANWRPIYGGQETRWREFDEVFGQCTAAIAEGAYALHPVVSACVDLIGESAAEPALEVGWYDPDGEWQTARMPELMDVFEHPSGHTSGNGLVRHMAAARQLTGYAYILKIRNRSGSRIANLWPIPTSWVTPVKEGAAAGQPWGGFRVRGQEAIVPYEDMIVLRRYCPGNPIAGTGCFEAAYRAAVLDIEREQYQAEMVSNLKVPGVAVITEQPLTAEEKTLARQEFSARFGRGHRGDIAFISGSGRIEALNPLGDLDWPGLTALSETRICTAFGVSPLVVHTRAGLERSTYNNYETALRAFYQTTMRRLWESMADELTLSFQSERNFDSRLQFRFRYDEHPQFQSDLAKESMRLVSEYTAGLIPRRFAQIQLGYDPDEIVQIEREEIASIVRPPDAPKPPVEDAPTERETEGSE